MNTDDERHFARLLATAAPTLQHMRRTVRSAGITNLLYFVLDLDDPLSRCLLDGVTRANGVSRDLIDATNLRERCRTIVLEGGVSRRCRDIARLPCCVGDSRVSTPELTRHPDP